MIGRWRPAPAPADLGGRLVAVELRHLAVHQHRRVVGARSRGNRLASVADDVGAEAQLVEQAHSEQLVDRAVLGHEHDRRLRGQIAERVALAAGDAPRRRFAGLLAGLAGQQRDLEEELAALADGAGGADRAAHQIDEPSGDRQPQPGAAILARGRGVGLVERLKETG